jgi:hypothetical protein
MSPGHARPAARADNAALIELFGSVPMTGSLVLSTRREPDFFALYDIQRGDSECWVYDLGAELGALGAFVCRDGWLGGRATRVGYLGDLRSTFAASRERGLLRFYGPVFGDVAHRHGCEHFLTAVLASNASALRALVHRRPERASQPRYTFLRRFAMVSIQFAGRRGAHRSSLVTRRATAADLPVIVALLDRDHRQRPFGYRYDQGELEHRLEHWPGMTLDRTYVALDVAGRMVGVTSAWDASAVKRYRVLAYRGAMRWTRMGWNLAARLRRWPRLPEPGRDFRYLYLCNTSIEGDRPDVLRALLERVYAEFATSGYHFFSLPVYENDPLAPALRGFMTRPLEFHLYAVSRAEQPECTFGDGRPGFEMALA